jgi:hypothetical protein
MNTPPCHFEDALWLMQEGASGTELDSVLEVFGEVRLLGLDPFSPAARAVMFAALDFTSPDAPCPDVARAFHLLRADLNAAAYPKD